MSQLDYIHYKLNEFRQKHFEDPTRIILGRNQFMDLMKNASVAMTFIPKMDDEGNYYNSVFGMRIIESTRPNYVRILPAKMKYRYLRKKNRTDYYFDSIYGLTIAQPKFNIGISTV